MRNVEALDAEVVEIVGRQIERFDQCARTRLLRALFGQQARQLQACIGLRHFQPVPALLARLVHRRDARARMLRDGFDQRTRHLLAEHQRRRHRHVDVMLRDEGFEHLDFDPVERCSPDRRADIDININIDIDIDIDINRLVPIVF